MNYKEHQTPKSIHKLQNQFLYEQIKDDHCMVRETISSLKAQSPRISVHVYFIWLF